MAKVVITIEDAQENSEDGEQFNIKVHVDTIPPTKAKDLPKGTMAQQLAVDALDAICVRSLAVAVED